MCLPIIAILSVHFMEMQSTAIEQPCTGAMVEKSVQCSASHGLILVQKKIRMASLATASSNMSLDLRNTVVPNYVNQHMNTSSKNAPAASGLQFEAPSPSTEPNLSAPLQNKHTLVGFARLFSPDWNIEEIERAEAHGHQHDKGSLGLVVRSGRDIWNASIAWQKVSMQHPTGVTSNVHGHKVLWADVGFLDFYLLYAISCVSYPFLFLAFLLTCTLSTSMLLTDTDQSGGKTHDWQKSLAISTSTLTESSKLLYWQWTCFCRAIPVFLVFGMPLALMYLSFPYPQETYVLVVVTSTVLVLSNGMYLAFFAPMMLMRMNQSMQKTPGSVLDWLNPTQSCHARKVVHWVIFPNYKEDLQVLEDSISSMARSSIAKTQICVLLAMELREAGSKEKAAGLKSKFASQFREMAACYHPPDLPNDPAGKASNVAYAFRWLSDHVRMQDTSQIVLTISDADSDFHENYFDSLTKEWVNMDAARRSFTLWQAPIFHIKNYYRQPMLCAVGTMFTAMSELAVLADPNAIRFPYSTYSLSYDLADSVCGWDAEWIAEDWHMGIKCFLLTLGRTKVEPILVPTINYTPEEETWIGTVNARWIQAKRHALGFSDLAYFFMMLPLITAHLRAAGRGNEVWSLFVSGIPYIIRLVNTHVIIGVMTLYMVIAMILRCTMRWIMGDFREFSRLFQLASSLLTLSTGTSLIVALLVAINFQFVYKMVQSRLDPTRQSEWIFRTWPIHCMYCFVSFVSFSSVYCFGLAACVWIAAFKVLLQKSHHYEVAAKPTKERCLGATDI